MYQIEAQKRNKNPPSIRADKSQRPLESCQKINVEVSFVISNKQMRL